MSARVDMHVHSTFSDGRDRLEDNVAEAEALGLTALGCVDHVRADTGWVPGYVAAVHALRPQTGVELRCGIEAKLLDTTGALDLPAGIDGVDAIYAADHQVPLPSGPVRKLSRPIGPSSNQSPPHGQGSSKPTVGASAGSRRATSLVTKVISTLITLPNAPCSTIRFMRLTHSSYRNI